MKHIAFLTLTLTRGGAERVITNLCNDALVQDYKVSIITCMNKPIGYELHPDIEYICIEKTSDIHYSNLGERFLKRRRLLKVVLQECKPDVLLCFLPEPNFLALSIKKYFSFPMIISVRNDPVHEYHNPVYRMMMKYLYPKADGFVFQTKKAKTYFSFSKKIMERAYIIPNPLAKEYIGVDTVSEEERVEKIVNVGKLGEQKNQKLLLKAFAQIVDKYPQFNLEIYGEGDYLVELEQTVLDLGIAGKVYFRGNVSDLQTHIRNAAIFVMSSDYEGMPNALMEAMAMGIPCISTDCPCGGPAYLIEDHKNGILVPVGNVEKMVAAMEEMILNRDDASNMGMEAKRIQEKLNPVNIHQDWNKCIRKYIEKE